MFFLEVPLYIHVFVCVLCLNSFLFWIVSKTFGVFTDPDLEILGPLGSQNMMLRFDGNICGGPSFLPAIWNYVY